MVEIFAGTAIGGTFLIALGAALAVMAAGLFLEQRREEKSKRKTYLCGEKIKSEKLNVPPSSIYGPMLKTLRAQALKEMHSGKLTTYLLWFFAGIVLLFAALVVFI